MKSFWLVDQDFQLSGEDRFIANAFLQRLPLTMMRAGIVVRNHRSGGKEDPPAASPKFAGNIAGKNDFHAEGERGKKTKSVERIAEENAVEMQHPSDGRCRPPNRARRESNRSVRSSAPESTKPLRPEPRQVAFHATAALIWNADPNCVRARTLAVIADVPNRDGRSSD